MEFPTTGETMLERTLQKEMRAGVPHYVAGQHQAEIVDDDLSLVAILSYVSIMGNAVKMLVRKEYGKDAAWEVISEIFAAGQVMRYPPRAATGDFSLSEKSLAALAEAERKWAANG